jgi:hypothetical protein
MTDKSYYHNVIGGENIDIKNCTLTCHIAIQPISYSKLLNQNVMWESLAKDRFLRFFMLNPIRKDTVNNPPEIIDLDCTPLDDIYVNTDISSLIHTFQNQVSIGRANNVSISIAKALASVMGYNTVNDTVVNFFNEFFKPYLDLIPSLEYRENAGSEVKIHSGFINLISAVSEIETVGRAWIDKNPINNNDLSVTSYMKLSRQQVSELSEMLIRKQILREEKWDYDKRYKYLELSGSYNDLFHLIEEKF